MTSKWLQWGRKVDYPFSTIARRIKKMKGKLLVFLFGVAFMTLAQLLVYYGNPANWTDLESALHNPMKLIYNLIFLLAPILMLILLWRLIAIEDKHEKDEQTKKDNKQIEAIKEALKEDREIRFREIAKEEILNRETEKLSIRAKIDSRTHKFDSNIS
jgi:uncharacterized membrane protein